MPNTPSAEPAIPPLPPLPPLISVPAFWPMVLWARLAKEGPEALAKNLKFAEEEIKIHAELRPKLATPNVVRLDLRTMVLRDYGRRTELRPPIEASLPCGAISGAPRRSG